MKENLVYLLIVVILLGAGGYWYYRNRTRPAEVALETPEEELILSPTEGRKPAEEKPEETISDLDLIKEALAKKYNKSVAEIEATISEIDRPYARGSVRFAKEEGGGWWLAYKEKGGWLIVADGNGTIPCETIEPYQFPKGIVPEC